MEINIEERDSFISKDRAIHKNDDEIKSNSDKWHLLGTRVPQAEIVYFCQMIIMYIIIITSIINLFLQNGFEEY